MVVVPSWPWILFACGTPARRPRTWQKPPRAGTTPPSPRVGDYLWSHHQKNGLPCVSMVLEFVLLRPSGLLEENNTAAGPGHLPRPRCAAKKSADTSRDGLGHLLQWSQWYADHCMAMDPRVFSGPPIHLQLFLRPFSM